MENGPLISIVTPSFNQGQYLEEMINSFIQQEYPKKELIIIDGGSKDDSVEIIKRYKDHIAYWISEPDNGQTDALSKGLLRCSGQIFNWINSDDKLHPGSLKNVAEIWVSNGGNVDLIAGNILRVNQHDGSAVIHEHIDYWNNLAKTIGYGQMAQPGMFYRTEVVKKLGLNSAFQFSMDIDLFTRFVFSEQNSIAITKSSCIFAEFRLHDQSKTMLESEKDVESAFFIERLRIFFSITMELNDNLSFGKLSKIFPDHVPVMKYAGSVSNVPKSKLKILRSSIDYFLFQQFMKFLFEFKRDKIRLLYRTINWSNIELKLKIKAVSVLNEHFWFYLRNKFKRFLTFN